MRPLYVMLLHTTNYSNVLKLLMTGTTESFHRVRMVYGQKIPALHAWLSSKTAVFDEVSCL